MRARISAGSAPRARPAPGPSQFSLMPHFTTSRRAAHSAEDMFALVADVERYPEFLPLCEVLTVKSRVPTDDGAGEVITADMTVAYKLIRETFTSRVTIKPAERRILVEYIDGPFHHLENRWKFEPIGADRCEVDFFLDYAFKSRALELVMGKVFDRAFRKFSDAFETRANALYGYKRATA